MSSDGKIVKPDFKDVKLSTDQQSDHVDICLAPESRAFDKRILGLPVSRALKRFYTKKYHNRGHPVITELPKE